MSHFLDITREGAVLVLSMNHPGTRNALNGGPIVDEFLQAFEAAHTDASLRAIVLRAEGPVFCAGGNLKDMQRYLSDEVSSSLIQEEYRQGIQRLPRAFQNLDLPVIAAINGPALGVGLDLACMCDIRIASEAAIFAESFVKVGLVPGDGGAWLLPRVVGLSRASELAFTGDTVDAAEALAMGLISRVVPAESLQHEAIALAQRIANNAGSVLRMTKRLLREGQHASLDSVLETSAAYQALAHKTPAHREAVSAFLEKRRPRYAPDH